MRGIGSGSFDSETLVILETPLMKRGLRSRVAAAGISGPTSSRDESAISRWKANVIPCDCMTGRLGS